MYSPVTSDWDQVLRGSGRRIASVDVYPGLGVTTPLLSGIPIESYAVTTDRRSANRRSATITVVDSALVDELKKSPGESPIEPYGAEFVISAGVVHPDQTEELIPLGWFQAEEVSWDESDSAVSISLADRSKVFERITHSFPYDASGDTASELLANWFERAPWLSFTIDSGIEDIDLPGGTTYQGTFLDSIQAVALALGAEFYFDVDGVARFIPTKFIDEGMTVSQADWKIDAGANGVLVKANSKLSRRDLYNRVTVIGAAVEGESTPWHQADDLDPTSRTYIDGPFGIVDHDVQRQELTTNKQCKKAANALINAVRGLAKTLDLTSLYNPALQEGDTIGVYFPDGRAEIHMVDKITFNNSAGMSVDTRSQIRPVT